MIEKWEIMQGKDGYQIIIALNEDKSYFIPISFIPTNPPHVHGMRYAELIQKLPSMYNFIKEHHEPHNPELGLDDICDVCDILKMGKILEEEK